jgi:hypothetical protein
MDECQRMHLAPARKNQVVRLDVDTEFGMMLRIYDFTEVELGRLWHTFADLAAGLHQQIPLHEQPYLEPLAGCRLTLATGDCDRGIVHVPEANLFGWGRADGLWVPLRCELRRVSWYRVASAAADLLHPWSFGGDRIWLHCEWGGTGEARWLLSSDGEW